MRVTVAIQDGMLHLDTTESGLSGQRSLNAAMQQLADYTAEYERLRGRAGADGRLLALGRELYTWLDGSERWLERLLDVATPPLTVEFQAPTTAPNELQKAFLQVPWELLASAEGYLAEDAIRLFCPTRRLGKAAQPPPLDQFCLGLMFMAAAPRGADELDYGAEENAILDATGSTLGLELVVEESGNPELLAQRMAEVGAMQVLHLSCHGENEPRPLLLLEDPEGNRIETGPEELVPILHTSLPRLVFLSACKSATAGVIADPLALMLVRAGVPAVLGWDGSVYDHEATLFAQDLYTSLALGRPVEEAVSVARRRLLHTDGGRASRDWHLARLWLGPRGGSVLVRGNQQRWMLAPDHGHKAFLDKRKQQSPVASREAFVGR